MVMVQMLRDLSETGLVAEGQPTRPLTAAALVFDILPYVREDGQARFLEPFLRPQPPMLIAR